MMIVDKKSWHYRVWKWMNADLATPPTATFCEYWRAILVGFPLCSALFACIITVISPILLVGWILGKTNLPQRFKDVSLCPWGRIEFK